MVDEYNNGKERAIEPRIRVHGQRHGHKLYEMNFQTRTQRVCSEGSQATRSGIGCFGMNIPKNKKQLQQYKIKENNKKARRKTYKS